MERNVSRFLQFWMRGRQQEKREGKVLSRRSHAAFRTFLPCSETLTGGDKHIWGIGRNCKIGLQMIVPWPEKIFAPCNCAPNPPFVPKSVRQHVAGEKQNLKTDMWNVGAVPTLYCRCPWKYVQIYDFENERIWCPCDAICLGHFGMKRCNLPTSAFSLPHCTSRTLDTFIFQFWNAR